MRVFLKFSCNSYSTFFASFCALSSCFCGCDNNIASISIYLFILVLCGHAGPIFVHGRHSWLYKCPALK